ncbi:hypothetical protein B4113_0099 [Geobacillus sp. B4113_201601]|nr:hypothetical protein B4113_0099 [Geobacillus sp. B4113_201601]
MPFESGFYIIALLLSAVNIFFIRYYFCDVLLPQQRFKIYHRSTSKSIAF